MADTGKPCVAIAGASGFIGKSLCAELSRHMSVVALSRRAPPQQHPNEPCQWRQADLFSLLQVEQAVSGATCGIYLVHSMQPTSRMTQGSFADIDLILADNFARAARKQGLRRIIYLGGIIPQHASPQAHLSPHLRSRLEVERVLGSYGTEVIAIRAGLVVGRSGSSFKILESLVRRLPLMLCPRWTQTLGQPIALSDVVTIITRTLQDPELPAGAYDIGGADVLSYIDMMRRVAKKLGLWRAFFGTRLFTPTLSRLWVSLITGAPKELIYPLIESLKHEMIVQSDILFQRYGLTAKTFSAALDEALTTTNEPLPRVHSQAARRIVRSVNSVCSIQRLRIPHGRSVAWASQTYSKWLPRFLAPLIRVDVDAQGSMRFYLQPLGLQWQSVLALELSFSRERSSETRSLYYITGGVLSDNRDGKPPGRFEFRQVPGHNEVVIAILNYLPRLPWWFYVWTQAQVHVFVMNCFGRVTRRLAEREA